MTLLTTTWTDDDGSGSVGTIINAAQLASIYQNAGRADGHNAGGRLTLTSGTPVTTADVTAATTVYYSPYIGDVILLYDGTATWQPISFAETSIAVPATTSQMYDVFGYNNSGTLTLELLAWTNDTTRATALVLQNGIFVKTGVTTRRYLGSLRTTTVSGQTEDSAVKRYVWNNVNRVPKALQKIGSQASYAYTTGAWRQVNADATYQLDLVIGLNEDVVTAGYTDSTTTSGGVTTYVGITLDGTGAPATANGFGIPGTAGNYGYGLAVYTGYPGIGRHFLAAVEFGATGATFVGPGSTTGNQLLYGTARC